MQPSKTHLVLVTNTSGEMQAYGPYDDEGQAVGAAAEIENDDETLTTEVLPLEGRYYEAV